MADPDLESYLQLVSLAVHELRTPTSVVAGYLRMLQRDTDAPLSERQRKMIDEAERSCQRLGALIAELSEIQKFDTGQIQLQGQRFDLFEMIGEVAGTVHEADDREVRLIVRGEARGALVQGDLARLQRAFSAIFRAILREMPGNTDVVVERRTEQVNAASSAVIVVAADANVQSAYSAAPVPFDEKRGGLGLELPFARRIIERHGGRVHAPDQENSRGAAIVTFPLPELTR